MLIPSKRLIALAALLLAAAPAVSVWPGLGPAWLAAAAAAAAVAGLDALRAARRPGPAVDRVISPVLPLGVTREVTLAIANASPHALAATVRDFFPAAAEARGLPAEIFLPPGGSAAVRYTVRPIERGHQRFGQAELRIRSPLFLWELRRRAGSPTAVRVYPNFGAVARYALFATDHRLSQLGVLQRRRRGEGLEFHQLRDYRPGDALRQIEWKASHRLRKLVSREYQDERNQQVMFLIDCGRRMAARDDVLSHFDHALNSVLLLAYVALRQGDAVGMMTMGADPGTPPRYAAPRSSADTLGRLLNTVFDLQPSLAAPDFLTAGTALAERLRKRALVVVVTNVRDEDSSELGRTLQLLRRRHLVLLASLREQSVREMLLRPVRQLGDAIGQAAAADYLMARRAAFARFAGTGALCVDVEPEQLPLQLVNRYLEVKRAGVL